MPCVVCAGDFDQAIEQKLSAAHSATRQGQNLVAPPFGPGIRHLIQGISVSNEQIVLGPGGVSINSCNGCDLESLSDEHSTIFPPGTFKRHPDDYLFFAAPKGVIVLTGGAGPDAKKGQWTLDYARDYGQWWPNNPPGFQNGAVFTKAGAHMKCPEVPDATQQDPTFDLNYALPGSLVIDPTVKKNAEPGRLLMIYEGTNRCMGTKGPDQPDTNNFYSTVGVATSDDAGHSWPAYVNGFTSLDKDPTVPYEGPNAPDGAWGNLVCKGGLTCNPEPASNSTYGRYAVLSEPVTVRDVMADADNFQDDFGKQEHGVGDAAPNAFIDPVHRENGTYLYVLFMGDPGFNLEGCLSVSYPGTDRGLKIARAKLNGATARLKFMKWYGPNVAYGNPAGSFKLTSSAPSPSPSPVPGGCPTNIAVKRTNRGLGNKGGGLASPIFPLDLTGVPGSDSFKHCQAAGQRQTDAQLSYVPATGEYLLTFVCISPSDPLNPLAQPKNNGAAWFYSTLDAVRYDLSRQDKWSPPQEIEGSWSEISTNADFDGWYPSFMSLALPSGVLGTSGYVFYLNGPVNSPAGRQYMTRQFSIATMPSPLPAIVSISVCSPTGAGGAGSCQPGSYDTHQIVLAPDDNSINLYGVSFASDEHSSVFSPGTLHDNSDYLFFVATGTHQNIDMGAVVLSGGAGPKENGQWTFDFPQADGYGQYGSHFGQIFLPPTVTSRCPIVADGDPTHQDQTFDLTYAAPGSVVKDSTSGPDHLLMIYEGVNGCVGNSGGDRHQTGTYISVGVATSLDYGRTWPTYRGTPPSFDFVQLPDSNKTQGPNAPSGALGNAVCMGNDCTPTPPATYGRYPILSLPDSLATAMATHTDGLNGKLGLAEPSAFLDDGDGSPAPYLYVMHGYAHGDLGPKLPNNRASDLTVARAQLNGGTAPLSFLKWDGHSFANPGIGGTEYPIVPEGLYENCGDPSQSRSSGSISYVVPTQQYLLTFICKSPTDPASGQGTGDKTGAVWFYSTSYDLSDPSQWSTPQEIIGSWSQWNTDPDPGCEDWKGWYPTFMSLGRKPGHLSANGYVFYLWGCLGGSDTPHLRQYSSRAFR